MHQDRVTRQDLALRDPFGLSRGPTSVIPVFHVQTEQGGTGCGSPVRYHGENADEGARQARELLAALSPAERQEPDRWEQRLRASGACACARAAIDMALHDALARSRGLSLGESLGVAPVQDTPSLFTIAIEDDARMVEKVERATWAPRLKVKLGRNDAAIDGRTLRAVRGAAPDKPILVDANAGWSREVAREMLAVCADLGVHLVEQPLAIGDTEGLRRLRRDAPVPFVVDEDAQVAADLPALRGAVHGINIKLMKCGGLREAVRMAAFAREEGWIAMLGCMIESSVGIAAAAHVASLARELDLDAEALVTNNPAGPSVLSPEGLLSTPAGPGLGAALLA